MEREKEKNENFIHYLVRTTPMQKSFAARENWSFADNDSTETSITIHHIHRKKVVLVKTQLLYSHQKTSASRQTYEQAIFQSS